MTHTVCSIEEALGNEFEVHNIKFSDDVYTDCSCERNYISTLPSHSPTSSIHDYMTANLENSDKKVITPTHST